MPLLSLLVLLQYQLSHLSYIPSLISQSIFYMRPPLKTEARLHPLRSQYIRFITRAEKQQDLPQFFGNNSSAYLQSYFLQCFAQIAVLELISPNGPSFFFIDLHFHQPFFSKHNSAKTWRLWHEKSLNRHYRLQSFISIIHSRQKGIGVINCLYMLIEASNHKQKFSNRFSPLLQTNKKMSAFLVPDVLFFLSDYISTRKVLINIIGVAKLDGIMINRVRRPIKLTDRLKIVFFSLRIDNQDSIMIDLRSRENHLNNCDALSEKKELVDPFKGNHSIGWDVQFKRGHPNYIIISQTPKNSMKQKSRNDGDFSPNEINKRYKYKRITEKLKDKLAKLYYLEGVKMAKMVKKYKISFSTLTDIFKRYDSNGERLLMYLSKATEPGRQSTYDSLNSPASNIQTGQIEPRCAFEVLQYEQTPEYIYYGSLKAVREESFCE